MTACRLVPAGEDATDLQPGDLVFLHRPGPVRAVIHAGQWVRPSLRPWARLTHVACVTSADGDLVEAVFPRVRRSRLTVYREHDYLHVATGLDSHDQAQALAYLDSRVGERYGVLICAGIAVRMLTPGHDGLIFARQRTGICSGIAAEQLERGVYLFDQLAAAMCPAELARALRVPAGP